MPDVYPLETTIAKAAHPAAADPVRNGAVDAGAASISPACTRAWPPAPVADALLPYLPDRFELVAVNPTSQTFQTFLAIIKASRIYGFDRARANAGESW